MPTGLIHFKKKSFGECALPQNKHSVIILQPFFGE